MSDILDLAQIDGFDRFRRLGDIFEDAESKGVLDPLPENKTEVKEEPITFERIRTIRERLFLLGYINSPDGIMIDRSLRSALRIFQKEAGLTVDGWVGRETWEALQQLVSFEIPFERDRWTQKEAVLALFRAKRLRLHTLGFLEDRSVRPGRRAFGLAEWHFKQVAVTLGFPHAILEQPALADEALFNQDAIRDGLARFDWGRMDDDGNLSDEDRAMIVRLAIGMARIELWLFGYDSHLGKGDLYNISTAFPIKDEALEDPLTHFWLDAGLDTGEAQSRSHRIDAALFGKLSEIDQDRSVESEGDQTDLLALFESADSAVQDKVWHQVKSLGSRIWDGVKRAWRWFKRVVWKGAALIRGAIHWTVTMVRNVARLLYGYALRMYRAIKRAYGTVQRGLQLVGGPLLDGTSLSILGIRKDRDLDFRVMVNADATVDAIEAIREQVLIDSVKFRTGSRVVAIFTDFLVYSLKRFAGGWIGLIFALVKLYRVMKDLGEVLDEEAFLLSTI